MNSCGCGCCDGQDSDRAVVHECVVAADELLAQTGAFVESLDEVSYSRPCAIAHGGTIGKHVRHLLDHFSAILGRGGDGVDDEDDALIDYDHRERGGPIETSRAAAAAAIAEVRSGVTRIDQDAMEEPVSVRVMVARDGRTIDLTTTFGRELAFATHHALHHHAMMRVIASSFGVAAPDELGLAPATVWGGAGSGKQ